MEHNFTNVVKYGKYYYPAWTHYKKENANVVCDRCAKTKLVVSIGLENTDLCLQCVDTVSKLVYKPKIHLDCLPKDLDIKNSSSKIDHATYIEENLQTRMAQSMFTNNLNNMTLMVQTMFTRPVENTFRPETGYISTTGEYIGPERKTKK